MSKSLLLRRLHRSVTFLTTTLLFACITAQSEVLWDNWYTVTEQQKAQSYYHERAEIVGDRAKIQVNAWIREGNRTRSENLGATAKNTSLLEPLLYNFRTQDATGQAVTIDGSIINGGKVFSVKVKRGIQAQKPIRAEMLPKLILASFFPVWIHKNYKRIGPVQPIEFFAIAEDRVEDQILVAKGSAYEVNPDDFAKKMNTRKIRVVYNGVVNFWWISKKGDAIRIEIPSQEKRVDKVTKEVAESFLSKL